MHGAILAWIVPFCWWLNADFRRIMSLNTQSETQPVGQTRGLAMTQQVDVLVIGGGVVGICAAHFSRSRGREVTVVEKDVVCAEARMATPD